MNKEDNRPPPKFWVKAKSKAETTHLVRGRITGGVKSDPSKGITGVPGFGEDYKDEQDARKHLEANGWTVIEFIYPEE